MKLFNTAGRQLENFDIQPDQPVSLYTCGPTVYDQPHIGNWVAYIRWDTLVRTLQLAGFQVNWVMNITDVGHLVSDADEGEDKMEKGARREGLSAWDIADRYIKSFEEGYQQLHLLNPKHLARATEFINQQIELVKRLEEKGFTYQIDDGVYFDTGKFPHYADFAKLDLQGEKAGARVITNPQKRQPADFALWKLSPPDKQRDMEWDSPWGKGFPGWHIECSAIAMDLLGETIDIHTGGVDHIPVHHTNEIAQSAAATGKQFVKYWLHNNHMLVDGQKISKSLGNGFSLKDLQDKGYEPLVFKLFVLQSHYRTQSNFSWANLEAAANRLHTFRSLAEMRFQLADSGDSDHKIDEFQAAITGQLSDDLNTPEALATVSRAAGDIESGLDVSAGKLTGFVQFLDRALGLELEAATSDIEDGQKNLIKERWQARQNQQWPAADEARHQLESQGIWLRDGSHKTYWTRQPVK